MNFYIADCHFRHENAIWFDKRPFSDSRECDEEMTRRWNEVVGDDDHVYILGDFCWTGWFSASIVLKQLKGHKHLVKGNHDKSMLNEKVIKLLDSVDDYLEIFDPGNEPNSTGFNLVLSHYPILSYKNMRHGWIHLYGHVHNSREAQLVELNKKAIKEVWRNDIYRAYNVGVMVPYMDYTPRTIEQIIDGHESTKENV